MEYASLNTNLVVPGGVEADTQQPQARAIDLRGWCASRKWLVSKGRYRLNTKVGWLYADAAQRFQLGVIAENCPLASVATGPGTTNQSTEGVMEISLSQEQIESLIEKSMPDIKKAVVENVASRMTWSISDTLAQQVKEFVTEWVKENVLPDVATHLVTNKDMLVGVAVESAPKIAMLVSEAMADSIKKTLEDLFSRVKLFDALLKS